MITLYKSKLRLLAQNHLFIFMLLVISGLIGLAAYQFHYFRDVTENSRNSVSDATNDLLSKMPNAIEINAFATDDDDYRENIKNFITRFQHSKSNIRLIFTNPSTDPTVARQAATKANGELIISYEKRSEHLLPPYTEQDVTNLLARLSRTHQEAIMILTGHGERDFNSLNEREFGAFAKQLAHKGFTLSNQDLNASSKLPKDSTMLVIASPTKPVSETDVKKIKTYLDAGGNLLWLLDDNHLQGLDEIAKYIGLEIASGVVINNEALQFGGDPKLAIATQYGDHPIADNFRMSTSFFEARKVSAHGTYENGWQVQDLIHASPNSWLETNLNSLSNPAKPPTFDVNQDFDGPINIAVVLERKYAQKGQRIIVVGNANFLDNKYIENNGNREMALNMVNWLAGDDHIIHVETKPLKDSILHIASDSHYKLVFLSFQLLIPIGVLIFGLGSWWQRKKS